MARERSVIITKGQRNIYWVQYVDEGGELVKSFWINSFQIDEEDAAFLNGGAESD